MRELALLREQNELLQRKVVGLEQGLAGVTQTVKDTRPVRDLAKKSLPVRDLAKQKSG